MQDRPNLDELMGAVADFLREDVLPELGGRTRYHMLVALNLLAVAQREINLAPEHMEAEWTGLMTFLEDESTPKNYVANNPEILRQANDALATAIRDGRFDDPPARQRLFAHLKRVLADTLRIANPRFLERDAS